MSGVHALSVEECWSHLNGTDVGRIGFDIGRGPRIHPVNYTVVDGGIVVRTEPGTELARCVALFSAGKTVAFEVDRLDDDRREGWSVLVGGRVAEVSRDAAGGPKALPDSWADGTRDHLIRIQPVEITGRRLGRPRTPEVGPRSRPAVPSSS